MTISSSPSSASSQRGSVIIWILIMVAMFAALSFAVANMMRGGGTGVSTELSRTHAAEIMSYGEGLRRAVQAMRASGTSLSEVSFENGAITGYANSNCADDTCRVFLPAGGGITHAAPHPQWLEVTKDDEPYYGEWHIAPDSCVGEVGSGGLGCGGDGTDNEELIAFLPYIKKTLCLEINRQVGIPAGTGDEPPIDSGCPWSTGSTQRFTGSFVDAEEISSVPASLLAGQQNGCFKMGICGAYLPNTYIYYQVLAPR